MDISLSNIVLTLKCTSSRYIPVIGHSKMELTDVDFSFPKNHWLFENNEPGQGPCLERFGLFKRNEQLFLYFAPG